MWYEWRTIHLLRDNRYSRLKADTSLPRMWALDLG